MYGKSRAVSIVALTRRSQKADFAEAERKLAE
jgi:hypothetical protein